MTRSKKNYRGRRLHKIGDRNDLSLDVCTGDAPLLQQCDLLLRTYLGARKNSRMNGQKTCCCLIISNSRRGDDGVGRAVEHFGSGF